MAKNDVTGDNLISKANSQAYSDNYERIFGHAKHKREASEIHGCGCTQSGICAKGGDSAICCEGVQPAR